MPAELDVQEFMKLFVPNQRHLRTYIRALLPGSPDVDDVFQETSVLLWRKFSEFKPGTNFTAWSFRVAHFVVLNARAKRRRSRVTFDQGLVELLAGEMSAMAPELDARAEALNRCLRKLSPTDRDLLRRRYERGATIKSIAQTVGRPIQGLYKAMQRIHDALFNCIQNRLTAE
jgi:RNA polymerase sigma-70 factor, ECF subfamily